MVAKTKGDEFDPFLYRRLFLSRFFRIVLATSNNFLQTVTSLQLDQYYSKFIFIPRFDTLK